MSIIVSLLVFIIFIIVLIFIVMMNKTSARDFFLHLGAIVALYTVTVSFINLAFKVVNKAFPEVTQNIYAWGAGSEISMPVATLIIFFPLLVILSRFVYKIYTDNPDKKELGVRKWLTYITLFVAGIILAADLVTVLYKFLDGQDLTAAFLLKALVVLLVAGAVFGYYLQDIRDRISARSRRWWAAATGAVVLVFIISGFAVLGSPRTQRLIRLDDQKISDLQALQWQVISYWQVGGMLPESQEALTDHCSQNYCLPSNNIDDYEYRKTGDMEFELCADFNLEGFNQNRDYRVAAIPYGKDVIQNYNWNHDAGRQCFPRVVDPVAYPTQVRG